jgi:hypothetical protein
VPETAFRTSTSLSAIFSSLNGLSDIARDPFPRIIQSAADLIIYVEVAIGWLQARGILRGGVVLIG